MSVFPEPEWDVRTLVRTIRSAMVLASPFICPTPAHTMVFAGRGDGEHALSLLLNVLGVDVEEAAELAHGWDTDPLREAFEHPAEGRMMGKADITWGLR